MRSHNIEWRSVTLKEFNRWLIEGFDTEKPFPFATWIIAVDGIPIDEVDGKTCLEILPEVYDFLSGLQDTWFAFSIQRTRNGGNNSSVLTEDIIEGSTET